MAAEFKRLQPSEYYSMYIDSAVRPDGRKLNSFGTTSVSLNCLDTANGSAVVNLNETVVLCGIKAELTNPCPENPKKGFIIPNVDFPPVCSPWFQPGPPSEKAQIFSQLMVDLIASSSFIKPEDLCVLESKLCWCLYVDITCLNYGGNVLDAAVLAMISAAKNTTLPEVCLDDDTPQITDKSNALPVYNLPFSTTFAVFENKIVADPTTDEEMCATGAISIFMKDNGTICNIHMHRGCAVSELCLKQCLQEAKARCKKLATLVNDLTSSCKK